MCAHLVLAVVFDHSVDGRIPRGSLCSAWGIVMFIMLPDSPVTAKLLTPKERRMAIERLRENQTGVENKHLKWYQVREALVDYKLYIFFLIAIVANVPNGGISNFGTIIIKGFGFSTLVTTLMQVSFFSSFDSIRCHQSLYCLRLIIYGSMRFLMAS